jgi:transcriptional repressor NrdR
VQCPYCGSDSRVLDSRGSIDAVRRRRECMSCGRRFTTYERLAPPEIRVVKRDGVTQAFDRDKIVRVVQRLTRDRRLALHTIENLAKGLEAELVDAGLQVVPTNQVADRLLARLRELDPVAASRYAANYQQEDGIVRTAFPAEPSPQLPLPLAGDPESSPEPESSLEPTRPAASATKRRKR